MKIKMVDSLPVVAVEINYNGKKRLFEDVLLDTGCATAIIDTDLAEE